MTIFLDKIGPIDIYIYWFIGIYICPDFSPPQNVQRIFILRQSMTNIVLISIYLNFHFEKLQHQRISFHQGEIFRVCVNFIKSPFWKHSTGRKILLSIYFGYFEFAPECLTSSAKLFYLEWNYQLALSTGVKFMSDTNVTFRND